MNLKYKNFFLSIIFFKKFKKSKIYLIIKIFLLILFLKNILFCINKLNKIKRMKIFLKGKKFINICLKGIFINKYKYIKSTKKIISAIIPVFNSQKSIKSSIRSIQNQNISEIEIILVNDFSKDNSLKIIEMIKKEDSRIIIINNKKNMGALYSRCIGVLSSRGTYIFALDNDDMFFNMDIFDSMYINAENEDFDIIGFKSIYIHKNQKYSIRKMKDNPFSNHTNNLKLYQPNLGIFPFSRNGQYKQNDVNIWGKCIKTYIYKKAVNSLGIIKYSSFMSWAEDSSIIFIIFNISKSFKFIHKYGIIHIICKSSASYNQPKANKLFGELFLFNVIFDFSNYKYKNLVVLFILEFKKMYKLKQFKFEKNLLFFKFILQKILKSKYIHKIYKKEILKIFKSFNF